MGPARIWQHAITVTLHTLPPEVVNFALSKDESREIKEAFSKYFMRKVASDEAFRYKLTVAIGEMHLGSIVTHNTQFAGISICLFACGPMVTTSPCFLGLSISTLRFVRPFTSRSKAGPRRASTSTM